MKLKIFKTLAFCLCSISLLAQTGNDSTSNNDAPSIINPIPNTVPEFDLQQANPSANTLQFLNEHFSDYQAFNFDFDSLNNYLLGNPYALEFNLNDRQNTTFLSLQRRDLRSPNFIESETSENGENIIKFERSPLTDSVFIVRTVNGFADRNKSKICRFAINTNDLKGYIWNTETNQVLYYISLQEFIKETGSDFTTSENFLLVYDLKDLIGNSNAICGVINETDTTNNEQYRGYFEQCTPRLLEIAAEGDYWWCQKFGSNATSKILESLFLVEGIYTHHFNLSFVINHINLLPNNSSLYNTTNSNSKIYAFQNNWNANNTSIDRDVAILYTGLRYDGSVIGNAFGNSLCNIYSAYMTMQSDPKSTLICAHELGHVFGSEHDDDSYNSLGQLIPGYGSSTCSGNDKPIMCSYAVADGPFYYFSTVTRTVILNSINAHAGCLNDYANGNQLSTVHKTWSNFRNPRWIATWFLNVGDNKVYGNFDGENDDDEIFFASPNNQWVGVMDFSCDEGTDWYHLWGNSGNRTFGTWYRNTNDRYLAGDCDGNGKSDLISISGNNQWMALQEYNPATWSWIHKWGNGGSRWVASWYINSNDNYRVADFDGDGKADLLCTNPNGWAQLIKFNWNSGGYYVPQTIWSNNGNGWVGGVQIGNTNSWLSGKYATTSKDELFTISGTWVTVQRFNGSSWDWIWSQYGANNFASMYILPLGPNEVILNGNFDADARDEVVDINQTWSATADFNGSAFTQNWNNGGNNKFHDWELNKNNEYIDLKASQIANKQILGIRTERTCTGWWIFKRCTDAPSLASMYKFNDLSQNFRYANPNQENENNTLSQIGLRVYPNPASNQINFDFSNDATNAKCTITDMQGRIVKSITVLSSSPKIDLNNLAAGSYVLNVSFDNNQSFTAKFVVYEK